MLILAIIKTLFEHPICKTKFGHIPGLIVILQKNITTEFQGPLEVNMVSKLGLIMVYKSVFKILMPILVPLKQSKGPHFCHF